MNSSTAQRLITLNREFYEQFGAEFSATRFRLQPGVTRVIETLRGDELILDLGCGNGQFARALAERHHHAPYLGLDFSRPLLADAERQPEGFSARFIEADLTQLSVFSVQQLATLKTEHWSLITCFATLHHIPSKELRVQVIETARKLLAPKGHFVLSNWQFQNSAKLRARVQPWSRIGLADADVDEGDFLLDWRRGGEGLRYVHQFSERELGELAESCGFRVIDSFLSDGESGDLGLYQVWEPINTSGTRMSAENAD